MRAEVIAAIRRFFDDRGFILVDTPIFTPAACEGTTTLFPVEYFDDTTAYLTQSGQLYNEADAMALGSVYCFGPTFRAEKSKTRRHLTEFWMVEPEVAFAKLDDVIELAEDLVVYVVGARARAAADRADAPRARHLEARARAEALPAHHATTRRSTMLNEKGQPFEWGDDFGAPDETLLASSFDRPVVVHRYPSQVKAFYMEPDPQRPEVALCVDVLAPEGYGEIIGGSQRIADYDAAPEAHQGARPAAEAFEWYLDLRRYGSVPHGGLRHGHRARRAVDLRPRSSARGDSVRADAVPDLPVARDRDGGQAPIGRSSARLANPESRIPRAPSPTMKIGFVSLGCPKNLVDSEVMIGLVQQAGHDVTADAARRRRARREHVRLHRRGQAGVGRHHPGAGRAEEDRPLPAARRHRAASPSATATELRRRSARSTRSSARARCPASCAPWPRLPPSDRTVACRSAFLEIPQAMPRPAAADLPNYLYDADTPRTLVTPKHYAYVKVAEGCDYTCAFCIIPTLRGHYRSRDPESIVTEARRLAARGVRELLLISQDTTFYGVDRGERGALARLLRELNRVDGLEWIRLLYLYPTTIGDDVLDAMAESEKVCRYIDLPLQHASPAVLKRMKRPGHGHHLPAAPGPDPGARAGRRAPDDAHRRVPGRDGRGVRRTRAVCAGRRVRPPRRVHLLPRRRHRAFGASRRRARGREDASGATR